MSGSHFPFFSFSFSLDDFLSFSCLPKTNLPFLSKELFKVPYDHSIFFVIAFPDVEVSSSLDSFLAFKAMDLIAFLRPHHKWRAKVTRLKESKDLSSLALDELIGNLKVHEVVMEKDSKIYKGKNERIKSIALKAKKESSDDETSRSKSDDEEYVMAVRNFKKFFRRKGKFVRQPREERKSSRQRDEKKGKSDQKCFRCGDPSHLIGDCLKISHNKDQMGFIGGSWSDSENDAEPTTKRVS
ncbi:zf-CCHC domain-containing protein [Tanacetum coccineum]